VNSKDIQQAIHEWQRYIGKKGGAAMTEKKRKAAKENAERAREIRAEKRRLGTGR